MFTDRTAPGGLLLLVALATMAHACGGGGSEVAVAVPSATVNRAKAPLGSPVEIVYRFQVAADVKIDGDYRVMVHFVDRDDELMWTDDHDPPVPTSRWKPGQTIEYTRTLFVPVYPYLGSATIQLGLYDAKSQGRLVLSGRDNGQKAYTVASLELLPQSEGIFLVYGSGWHDQEIAAENSNEEWRWTKKEAAASFRNPQRDIVVYLDADGRTDVFDSPQHVSILIGNQTVDTFPVETSARFLRKSRVSAGALGTGDMVDLTIAVDKTFVPAEHGANDRRELGLRVFHVFVESQ
jgi:hypothetical protein